MSGDQMPPFLGRKRHQCLGMPQGGSMLKLGFDCYISGQIHEFIVYAMRQQTRADNVTICYHKKQIDVTFCGFSNLEQVLPFRAIFEQNIGLEHISSTKKSTISWKTSIHANFLNGFRL